MTVKSYQWLAVFAVLLSATVAQAQYGGGGAIRSATFGGSQGLGVLPVGTASALSDLNLSGGGGGCSSCGTVGCTSPGCGNLSLSCADPSGCASCGDIGCAGGCCPAPSGCCPVGCGPFGWTHKFAVFGEFLYLRPRNQEVPYAVVQDSNLPLNAIAPIQVSRLGIVDHDYQPAFRGGFSVSLGTCSSITAQYTMFESTTTDFLTLGPKGASVIGLTQHPAAQNANTNAVAANAASNVSFKLVDVDYRELLSWGPSHKINYLMGTSYGNLEQQFASLYDVNGGESVFTDIDFDGAGLRLGLEMERYSRNGGMLLYAKGISTLLAGEFRSTYFQGQDFDNSVVETHWKGGRIMPVLQLETGMGWQLHGGAYRFTCGYSYNAWYNAVTTQDWIRSVQQNDFTNLSNTMTFDGLVARVEARF